MADWFIDLQLVDGGVTRWLSFQLSAGINKCQAYGKHLNRLIFLSIKHMISMQADDDDSIVSSLTLKLRYSKHTHTAFL